MLVFLLALACGGRTGCTDDPLDTGACAGTPDDVPLIRQIRSACADGQWTYEADVDAKTSGGTLDVTETADPAWSEQHTLASTGDCADADGSTCDVLVRELAIVEDADAQVADQTTLFACTDEEKARMTWRIEVFDASGERSDCAVWGADPTLLGDDGCLVWSTP